MVNISYSRATTSDTILREDNRSNVLGSFSIIYGIKMDKTKNLELVNKNKWEH